jgi:pilus assembly protein Flp/PilA
MVLSQLGQYLGYGCIRIKHLALWRERRAVTSVEYSMIALIIVLGILLGVTAIGQDLVVPFNSVSSEL